MEKLFFTLFITICIVVTILLAIYKGNTKARIIIRFSWFVFGITFFFLFQTKDFSIPQNLFAGFFGATGLAYFFYKFKKLAQRTNH